MSHLILISDSAYNMWNEAFEGWVNHEKRGENITYASSASQQVFFSPLGLNIGQISLWNWSFVQLEYEFQHICKYIAWEEPSITLCLLVVMCDVILNFSILTYFSLT